MIDLDRACSVFGEPGRPAIVFLHGIRLGREIWEQHAAALSGNYRVLTLDLPGHGALHEVPFTQENVAAVVDAAIDRLADSPLPPLVVGYSLGGFVAMRYAVSEPQRTSALLLAGCTLDFEGWKWWPYGVGVRMLEMLPDDWLGAMLHAALYVSLPHEWVRVVEKIPFDRSVLSRTSEMVRTSDRAIDAIASYRKPVLFVNGEYDLAFRSDERRFLHRLPQARLKIVSGVDHTGPLRRVAEFTAIVEAFADSVFAQAGTA